MATPGRPQSPDLNQSSLENALREDSCSFQFFQAVTLLKRLLSEREPIGHFCNPEDEVVHFGSSAGLTFPASQIQELRWESGEIPQMKVNFMGLTGPMGVLPHWYSELVAERLRSKDETLQHFFDIFNHRAMSFFYRAWEKYRFPVTYGLEGEDQFTHYLLDFMGLGTPGLQHRQAVPDEALVRFTALLGNQVRSAAALEAILTAYFEVPAEVEQFTGAWYRLDPETQCCVDDAELPSQQLGQGAIAGDEIWDQQSRVRVKLGPLSLERYRDFLPNGSAFEPLRAITRFFSNDEFEFEVQLILKRDDVPGCDIGASLEEGPQLGWVSWLKSIPLDRDPQETVLPL